MRKIIYVLFVLLIFAHQDFWWWHSEKPLILGFIPIGLAWHVGISIGAACLGALAVKYAWPADVDEIEEQAAGGGSAHTRSEHA